MQEIMLQSRKVQLIYPLLKLVSHSVLSFIADNENEEEQKESPGKLNQRVYGRYAKYYPYLYSNLAIFFAS